MKMKHYIGLSDDIEYIECNIENHELLNVH